MNRITLATFLAFTLILPLELRAQTVPFTCDNEVALSMVEGEIPAPIETTRFQDSTVLCDIKVDFTDLSKTTGTVKVDLLEIQSKSFSDQGKNKKQTDHMKNWFEIGPDVSKETRAKNRWAVFEIKKILSAEPNTLQQAEGRKDEIGTAHVFKIKAKGDLTVHQVTSEKTADLNVVVYDVDPDGKRYQEARRVLLMRTGEPIEVSMEEHGVKPRDATGKFLSKALSVVGLKISDTVKISFDIRAFQPRDKTSSE